MPVNFECSREFLDTDEKLVAGQCRSDFVQKQQMEADYKIGSDVRCVAMFVADLFILENLLKFLNGTVL